MRPETLNKSGAYGGGSTILLNNQESNDPNEYFFEVPIRDISNGATALADPTTDKWSLVGSTGNNVTATDFRDFQPGDLFRGRVVGNNGKEIMHSGVVSAYDPTANRLWLVDNFIPNSTASTIQYTDFIVDSSSAIRHINNQFAVYRLDDASSNFHDVISGSGQSDYIGGGRGNDDISGGGGNDWLWGGLGNDRFSMTSADGQDRILDFQDGADLVVIKNFSPGFAGLAITGSGSDTRIAFGGASVSLVGVQSNLITASDFIFQ